MLATMEESAKFPYPSPPIEVGREHYRQTTSETERPIIEVRIFLLSAVNLETNDLLRVGLLVRSKKDILWENEYFWIRCFD